jgi:hypothetical protein
MQWTQVAAVTVDVVAAAQTDATVPPLTPIDQSEVLQQKRRAIQPGTTDLNQTLTRQLTCPIDSTARVGCSLKLATNRWPIDSSIS